MFYVLWEEFAKRYAKYEKMLCFELLNEVTDQEYCEKWNTIMTTAIGRIRAIAPTIRILTGGYWNNSIKSLKDLCDPFDENIVYNFHFYEPLIFTHQGAHWIPKMDTSFRMPFDATYAVYAKNTEEMIGDRFEEADLFPADKVLGEEYFETYFAEAIRVAKERNVALYCGEYGVINLVDTPATPQ